MNRNHHYLKQPRQICVYREKQASHLDQAVKNWFMQMYFVIIITFKMIDESGELNIHSRDAVKQQKICIVLS